MIVVPTETVYGLACLPEPEPVARLISIKRRPADKHVQLLVPDASWLPRVGRPDRRASALAEAYWPGPLTLVVEAGDEAPVALLQLAADTTIGVRVPAHPVATALLALTGPLAASSANHSGAATPTTAAGVEAVLGGEVDLVLDGGTIDGRASTVVSVAAEGVRVLREGDITTAEIGSLTGR